MLRLSEPQLDRSLASIQAHGHGSFFPKPPEFQVVISQWEGIRKELADIDLDTYPGYSSCQMFAPKSKLNIRRVDQLHPYDLILYTALALELQNSITASRIPPDEHRVFSYRTEGVIPNQLYTPTPSFPDFRRRARELAEEKARYFGLTDIGDFFPRIYHHRLINALQSASRNSKADEIRCLEKMLYRFSGGTSYGIPIGPPASRLFGEAILIDVDSTLISKGIDFLRFVDDYVIVADRAEDAEYGIRELAEVLYLNHGLTLQTAKTKLTTSEGYLSLTQGYENKEAAHRDLIDLTGGYDDEPTPYEDLGSEEKKAIDALNLSGMLEEALQNGEQIDYQEVSFILSRLSSLREPDLIPVVLDNIEKLFPVAHAVARFFGAFDALGDRVRRDIANRLLLPIETSQHVSEYYAVWILSLFFDKQDWNNAPRLARIFSTTQSEAVQRFAALALATSGTRAEALTAMRSFRGAVPLLRSAILFASKNLGRDERKYTMKSLQLENLLERTLAA